MHDAHIPVQTLNIRMTLHGRVASQDRQRIKSDGPTILDLMHKHTLESTDKEVLDSSLAISIVWLQSKFWKACS